MSSDDALRAALTRIAAPGQPAPDLPCGERSHTEDLSACGRPSMYVSDSPLGLYFLCGEHVHYYAISRKLELPRDAELYLDGVRQLAAEALERKDA